MHGDLSLLAIPHSSLLTLHGDFSLLTLHGDSSLLTLHGDFSLLTIPHFFAYNTAYTLYIHTPFICMVLASPKHTT